MREFKFIVFLLVLASLSFANLLDSAQYIVGGTIAFVIVILALANMFATSFEMPQFEAWAKNEVRELIIGVILIVIVFTLFSVSTNILATLSGKTIGLDTLANPNLSSITDDFFNERTSTINNAYGDLMQAFHQIGVKAGFSTSIPIPVYFVSFSGGGAPFSAYGTFFIFLSQAAQGLSISLFIYTGLQVIMKFLLSVSPPLLYLAFAFRIFPLTRNLGNTLIALMIGAGILLPFSVIFLSQMHSIITLPLPDITARAFALMGNMPSDALPSSLCSNVIVRTLLNLNETGEELLLCLPLAWIPGYYPACSNLVKWVIYPAVMIATALWGAAALLPLSYGTGSQIGVVYDTIFPFLFSVIKLVVLTYIDVVVIGIITIIGTKSISSALGGEVFLGGIQRLL
ncbi:MAG: hypothetical protein Q7S22_06615 [Candidatus Micrarchaeota archaeon]|nr:hypothetical protein [Candidatus Micrarchaeota archaeon]